MSKIGWEKCAIFDNEWQPKEKKRNRGMGKDGILLIFP